ncbi:hypothetical protein MN608_03765 [Microdochium nivale]|nr:hypothetical protein MN608_03765 [Microdochium nivale]
MGKKSTRAGSPAPSPALSPAVSASHKGKASPVPSDPPPSSSSSSALVICRNKHWRFISSFHGPWLQLPVEVLETLANANYYMPLPRPVDPAVFYDLVKIRQLVDAATDLAVRAASGIAASPIPHSMAGSAAHQMQALGLGFGSAGGTKLSSERKFRMREQASQKLSKAYHLDEIASSVATMQSTSTLENVAGHVLQRQPTDPDANYVHFFHEKIPSRQLAECTDLRALDQIIGQRPANCEPLRTRATVRVFKHDYTGAAHDLTTALSVCRLQQPLHYAERESLKQMERRSGRRQDQTPLDEQDHPSSTEVQLLVQRASCYLTLACNHVTPAIPQSAPPILPLATAGSTGPEVISGAEKQRPEQMSSKDEMEHRKLVRLYAKRALRDYMDYLRHFHYSPDFPVGMIDDFTKQVNHATNKTKRYYTQPRWFHQASSAPKPRVKPHMVHTLSTLFAATPPTGLPSYPSTELVTLSTAHVSTETTTETVTYHPLLTDALHALLLCHALIQTSAKELQRHAYMVARLARLADGYPVFQASRSPAQADWIEVLRRSKGWLELTSSWETLCAPAPLPSPVPLNGSVGTLSSGLNGISINDGLMPLETERQRKDRLGHQAIVDALEDERVNDEVSFKAALVARQHSVEANIDASPNTVSNAILPPTRQLQDQGASQPGLPFAAMPKRWAVDDGREYPILTERAEAVSRWIRDAPAGAGAGVSKRKKKAGAAKMVFSLPKDEGLEAET